MDRADSLYDELESLSPEARLRRQMDRLRAVLAATTAPAAREVAARAGLLEGGLTLERLRAVPILRKEDLPRIQSQRPPFGGWASPSRVRKILVSPGPIHEPEGPGPDYWGTAPALHAAGIRAGDIVLNCFSYHLGPAGSILEGGLLALGAVVIPGGVGNTELQVRTAAYLGATGYVGTPSFLATLLEKADELGVRLPFEVAAVSAEPLPEDLRARFESRGIRTRQFYATADVGTIAYECGQARGLHLADRCITELVDPATGEPLRPGEVGEVVVTRLDPTYPLIRLGTGDLSILTEEPCPCGRTSPRLLRILGRVGEAVKVRGIFVHPAQVREAMARVPEVGRYRFAVRRRDHQDEFVVRVEGHPQADLADRIRQAVRDLTRLRVEVEFVEPGALPEGPVLADERRWDP